MRSIASNVWVSQATHLDVHLALAVLPTQCDALKERRVKHKEAVRGARRVHRRKLELDEPKKKTYSEAPVVGVSHAAHPAVVSEAIQTC